MDNTKIMELMDYIESNRIKPTNEVYYRYILRFSEVYPVNFLCSIFGIGKSSFYDWKNKIRRPDPDEIIRDIILQVRKIKHKETMGYRMVTNNIFELFGIKINHKKIYRIMKKYGLLSASMHSRKMSVLYRSIKPYSNLVNKNFNVENKNSTWCIDITKIDSKEGRQYLCAIIDLFDRSIVSYKMYRNQTVRLVKNTIQSALEKEDLSMCPKIILPPSLFSNLKKERLYIDEFDTNEDIALAVIDYIYWYNRMRPHGYNGCAPYEKRFLSL